MVRAASNVGVQFGLEVTPGTSVPSDIKLMGITLSPHAVLETTTYRASGYKLPVATAVNTDLTEADFEGPIDYRGILWPLHSAFGAPDTTEVTVDAVWEHEFIYTGKDVVTPKTFTVEVGDSTRAVEFTNAVFDSLELSIERTGDNLMSGTMFGRALATGATMTSSPSEIQIQPVAGAHWDVYCDTAHGSIGTTKLTSLYEAGINFSDLFSQEWTINSANASFNSVYESEEPSFEWTAMLGADAVGEGMLAAARSGATRYIRLKATGPIIETTNAYSITIDMAVKVMELDSYESNDGLYVLPITFQPVYDSNLGFAVKVTVTNDIEEL
jgi:hypothetical protein